LVAAGGGGVGAGVADLAVAGGVVGAGGGSAVGAGVGSSRAACSGSAAASASTAACGRASPSGATESSSRVAVWRKMSRTLGMPVERGWA